MQFKIGAISFLNTLPLIEWFETAEGKKHTLLRTLPSQLTEILHTRAAHVGLLPVAEILRGYSDGILMGTGIACKGRADSVKLFCEGPLENLTRIKADRGSRSSVALLQIILKEMYGITPATSEMIPAADMTPAPGEGLLIIGDRCFEFERAHTGEGCKGLQGWDLGELWLEMAGLPFVFAAWALAPGFVAQFGQDQAIALRDLLNHARDYGVATIGDIAHREAGRGALGTGGLATTQAVESYLRHSLRYVLGPDELTGMRKFQELGLKHGVFTHEPWPAIY